MKLKNFLIVVKDIERSRRFYHDLFGLDMLLDNGGNATDMVDVAMRQDELLNAFIADDFHDAGYVISGVESGTAIHQDVLIPGDQEDVGIVIEPGLNEVHRHRIFDRTMV